MKMNSFLSGSVCTLAFVFASAIGLKQCHSGSPDAPAIVDTTIQTDTVNTDTVYITKILPVPTDSVVYKYSTVRVPIAPFQDTQDSTKTDSATVVLPITQKMYQDSTYQAWVSGYEPALDSIKISQPVMTITNTITTTQTIYKAKKWGLGVQAGIGVTPKTFEPYIGIGVSYNIFSW